MTTRGYCEDHALIAKVLELKDGEIIWSKRTPDVFAAMPNFWQFRIVKNAAEEDAEDIFQEVCEQWNEGPRVGKRPQWRRFNKKSRKSDTFYVRFDDAITTDEDIAEALGLELERVKIIAARDYVQREESLTRERRRKKSAATKKRIAEGKFTSSEKTIMHRAKDELTKAKAELIAERVCNRYCGVTMSKRERQRVRKAAYTKAYIQMRANDNRLLEIEIEQAILDHFKPPHLEDRPNGT